MEKEKVKKLSDDDLAMLIYLKLFGKDLSPSFIEAPFEQQKINWQSAKAIGVHFTTMVEDLNVMSEIEYILIEKVGSNKFSLAIYDLLKEEFDEIHTKGFPQDAILLAARLTARQRAEACLLALQTV